MSILDDDSWNTEFFVYNRLKSELQEKLKDPFADHLQLKGTLEQLVRGVQQLSDKLDDIKLWKTCSPTELDRRKRSWAQLEAETKQIIEGFKRTASRADVPLLGEADGSRNGAEKKLDVTALKQTQIDMLEEQTRGLESLSQTISRQRQLATQLGHEVEDQNDILDNLANTMDRVESGVQRETGNISIVNRRDSTWGYWLIILILFIAIIVVAIV